MFFNDVTFASKMRTMAVQVLVLGMVVFCAVMLSSCGGQDNDNNTPYIPSITDENFNNTDGTPTGLDSALGGSAAPTVNFDLQATTTPTFDGLTTQQGTGLFTIVDGYAYAMDPDTLEPVGPALDPLTHEPIEAESEPEPAPPVVDEPVDTDDGKLPNTGIFLEDD